MDRERLIKNLMRDGFKTINYTLASVWLWRDIVVSSSEYCTFSARVKKKPNLPVLDDTVLSAFRIVFFAYLSQTCSYLSGNISRLGSTEVIELDDELG